MAVLLVMGLAVVPVKRLVETRLYPIQYSEEVAYWAGEYGLDPYLVYAVIRTESGFRPAVQSNAGAIGLMQMTEDTFDWLAGRIAPQEGLSYEALYEPAQAIRFGCYFLSICLERYGGDISTAAAAYHSGWGTVDRLLEDGGYSSVEGVLHTFPYRQMAHYVNKVNNSYEKYLKLYS